MKKVKIKYADDSGTTRVEVFEAKIASDVSSFLIDKGYYVLSEQIVSDSYSETIRNLLLSTNRVSQKELNEFTKLLRTLIKSGMPVTTAIDLLTDGVDDTLLNRTLKSVKADIHKGVSLSAALSKYPNVFPDIYVKTIIAGEKAGALEDVLLRLSEYLKSSILIKQKIVSALIYPAILLLFSSIAIILMLVFVVPEFVLLFESLEMTLPWYTTVVLGLSSYVASNISVLLAFVLTVVGAFLWYKNTPNGRIKYDAFKLGLPLIGTLEHSFAFSQFSRILATMVNGGIPLLDSLNIVLNSMQNSVFAARYSEVPDLIEAGMNFGNALKQIPETPLVISKIVTVGEESGNLGMMLDNIADHYDGEITELTDRVTALIEPLIFIVLAIFIGGFIVALIGPVLTAVSQI